MPNLSTTTSSKFKPVKQPDTLVYKLQTLQMLKMLSKLFPSYEWTSDWLQHNVKKTGSWTGKGITLKYKGQPLGSGTQHLWEIEVDATLADQLKRAYQQIANIVDNALLPSSSNKVLNSDQPFDWNGLTLRSPAEAKIATALQQKGILFSANARFRIPNRIGDTETRETDFLVVYQGMIKILEVDGQEFHTNRANDYRRDRLFAKHGLTTIRFTATECLDNPDGVINEFLDLFMIDDNLTK